MRCYLSYDFIVEESFRSEKVDLGKTFSVHRSHITQGYNLLPIKQVYSCSCPFLTFILSI